MYPKPFCQNISKVKAIVLGADPSTDNNTKFEYVFGIDSDDRRYFASIERNLKTIGLMRSDVYVQNLIQDYLKSETSKNKEWESIAEKWVSVLIKELDSFDPERKIPVLVTAEQIMKFLCFKSIPKAKDIYSKTYEMSDFIDNSLGRRLIPFYRHYNYSLDKVEFEKYREALMF